MYRGKITHKEIAPKGQLAKEKKVHCTIEKIGGYDEINVSAKRINALHGLFNDKTPSFGSLVKRLSVRYTFLGRLRKFLTMKRTSKLEETPSLDLQVDNSIDVVTDAPLAEHSALDVTVNEKFYASISARLVSYFLAPIYFVRKLVFECVAKLTYGESAIAKSIRQMMMTRALKATKGEGAIAKSKDNIVECGKDAVANSAPAELPVIENDFEATHEAKGDAGTAIIVTASIFNSASHFAKLIAWGYVVVDGVLMIRHSYEATQDGDVLFLGTIPETWDAPYYDESGALVIGQARLMNQSENTLGVI